jgi:hypothetical protein
MYTRHVVRTWQVIAEEVSKEHNQERFTELLTELSEALSAEDRKLKLHTRPAENSHEKIRAISR